MIPFHRPYLLALGALLSVAAPHRAQAASTTIDPAEIDVAIERFTGLPIGVAGGAARPVDRRLRLAQCHTPLALAWHGTRRDTIRVECPDNGSWRIFVAIGGSASSASATKAVVAISRGDAVSIVVRGSGFSVTQSGEAMEAGGTGEWIRVKPPGGGEPLRARIERPGLVIIPL